MSLIYRYMHYPDIAVSADGDVIAEIPLPENHEVTIPKFMKTQMGVV